MTKQIIVNKFGGGILKKDFIPLILKQLKEQTKKGYQSIAVVSAMPKVTDEILSFLVKLKESYKEETIKYFIESLYLKHEQIIQEIIKNKDFQEKTKDEIRENLAFLEKYLIKEKNINNRLEDKVVSYGEKLSAIILTHYLNSSLLKTQKFLAE
jgi:aspartokinase